MRILGGMIGVLAPESPEDGQLKYATLTAIISEVRNIHICQRFIK